MKPSHNYRIGEIAERTGVSLESLSILREATTAECAGADGGRLPRALGRGGTTNEVHQAGSIAWADT